MHEDVAQFACRVARGVDVLLNSIKLVIDDAFVVRGAFRLECGREPISSTQELRDCTLAWTEIDATSAEPARTLDGIFARARIYLA